VRHSPKATTTCRPLLAAASAWHRERRNEWQGGDDRGQGVKSGVDATFAGADLNYLPASDRPRGRRRVAGHDQGRDPLQSSSRSTPGWAGLTNDWWRCRVPKAPPPLPPWLGQPGPRTICLGVRLHSAWGR